MASLARAAELRNRFRTGRSDARENLNGGELVTAHVARKLLSPIIDDGLEIVPVLALPAERFGTILNCSRDRKNHHASKYEDRKRA